MFLGIPIRMLRPALLSILITFTFVPIMGLPYTADDGVNRNWPTVGFGEAISEAIRLQRTWIFEQGRFFPGGSIYALSMWNIFDSRVAYMTYLALLGMLVVALVGYLTWRACGSGQVAALAVVATGACMQVRFGYLDGIASFGGLVPYTIVLTLISALLAAHILRGGSRWYALPIVVLWSLAITAYEVSLLMLPAVLLMLLVTGPSLRKRALWLWAGLPLVVPAALQLGITFYLRRRELPLAPAYQIDLGGPVGTTFGKQFTAALPFAQQGIADAPINWTVSIFLILVLAVPVVLTWRPWLSTPVTIPQRVSIGLMAAGLWAWVVPSVLAAVTVRWQGELFWGQGYIYLPYEFVGFGLVLAGVGTLLRANAHRPWARIAFVVLFACLVAGCAVTAGVNIVGVGSIVPGPQGPG